MAVSYDLGTAYGKVVIEYDGKGAEQAQESMQKTKKSSEELGKAVGDVEPVLRQTSTGALVAGSAIAAGFALAVNAASDFEFQMSQVQAVSGASATELDALSQKALQLGADTSFSATEAAVAIEELVKSGLSVDDVLNGAADATVALAAAGQIELPEAAAIASAALNQFKLGAEDLVGVADTLAGAANASATGVSEIGMALSFVGPTAQAAGVSIEDAATMIALFANNGIDGARAGTSLRAIIATLASPTSQAKDALKELGLVTEDGGNAFFDAQGKMKPMAEVNALLRDSFAGLTQEQQIAYAETIFGREQISALAAITNTTAGEFDNLTSSIESVSAADVAAERLNNFQGRLEQLRGSMETAFILVGNLVLPALTDMVGAITQAVNWFAQLDEGTRAFLVSSAGIAGGLLLAYGAITKLVLAFASLRTNLLLATGATALFKTTTEGATVATKLAAAAQAVFNAVLNVNPIVRIIALVVALIAAIVTLAGGWDQIIAAFQPAMEAMRAAFEPLIPQVVALGEVIAGVFGAALAAIMPLLATLVETIFPVFVQIIEALAPVIGVLAQILAAILGPALGIVAKIFEALTPIITTLLGALQPLIDLLMMVLEPVLGVIVWALEQLAAGLTWVADQVTAFFTSSSGEASAAQTTWDGFVAWLSELWAGLVAFFAPIIETIATFFNNLFTGVSFVWNGIMTVVGAVIAWFQAYVVPVITAVINLVVAIFTFLWNTAQNVWAGIMAVVMAVVQWFVTYVGPVIQAVVNLVAAIFQFLWSVISTVWNAIWNVISTIVRNVVGVITAVWGTISGIVSGIFNAVWGFISAIWNRISSFIGSIVNAVVNVIRNVWNTISGFVSTIFNNVYNAIKEPLDRALSFIGGIKDKIIGFFAGAGSWLLEAGKNIIGGLIDGIENMLGGLTDVLNGITSMIPKEKGPPKKDKVLLEENGELIMQGLINGLRNEIPAVAALLGDLTTAIPLSMQQDIEANMRAKDVAESKREFNYYAAPGSEQFGAEEELFTAMRRSKVVVPGWA